MKGSLEPGRQRLQWAKILPLHSSLGDRVRPCVKNKTETHTKNKQTKQNPVNDGIWRAERVTPWERVWKLLCFLPHPMHFFYLAAYHMPRTLKTMFSAHSSFLTPDLCIYPLIISTWLSEGCLKFHTHHNYSQPQTHKNPLILLQWSKSQ